MNLSLSSCVKLSSGHSMPIFGFGVYEMSGRTCYRAVKDALEAGYRLIDSAEWYGNEAECGSAIRDFLKESGVKREEIFYTTKIQTNSTEAHAASTVDRSLKLSGLDYIDLYLIHSPYPSKTARLATWTALEKAVDQKKVRSIGVSNFGIRHLEEMISKPSVNQIDLHPFMRRFKDVEYNKTHGIQLMAWGPLVRGERFDHPALEKVARKHKKSTAQILLRWGVQQNYVVIPKSASKSRIIENADIFDFSLDAQDLKSLDGLDEHLVTDWDPIGKN